MLVRDICKRSVVTCTRSASALQIAQLMRSSHVGQVIVIDEEKGAAIPVGIVTDRDLVMRVLACGLEPKNVPAADLIGAPLDTVLESEAIYDAIWHMRRRGISRVPVVDDHGSLQGLLSKNDVTTFLATELIDTAAVEPREVRLAEAGRS